MKRKSLSKAGTLVLALFCCFAPALMAAEKAKSEDFTVLPYSVTGDPIPMGGLSTLRHTVTREQAMRQHSGVLLSFSLIDYLQTAAMLSGPAGYQELNPILGSHPNKTELIAFGLIGNGLFYLVGRNLPEPWKQIFLDSVLSIERMNIENNRRVQKGWNTDGPPIRGRTFNGIPIIISLRF